MFSIDLLSCTYQAIVYDVYVLLLPSEAMHQRVLYCDISDITNHRTDK